RLASPPCTARARRCDGIRPAYPRRRLVASHTVAAEHSERGFRRGVTAGRGLLGFGVREQPEELRNGQHLSLEGRARTRRRQLAKHATLNVQCTQQNLG